jgi:ribosomal protein S15P/S13E
MTAVGEHSVWPEHDREQGPGLLLERAHQLFGHQRAAGADHRHRRQIRRVEPRVLEMPTYIVGTPSVAFTP